MYQSRPQRDGGVLVAEISHNTYSFSATVGLCLSSLVGVFTSQRLFVFLSRSPPLVSRIFVRCQVQTFLVGIPSILFKDLFDSETALCQHQGGGLSFEWRPGGHWQLCASSNCLISPSFLSMPLKKEGDPCSALFLELSN